MNHCTTQFLIYVLCSLFLHFSAQGEECPPPPPVSWSHVTGLQASLLGQLKGFVKSLDSSLQTESSLTLIPAYLIYLEAYYRQLSKQVPFPAVYLLFVCVQVNECVGLIAKLNISSHF